MRAWLRVAAVLCMTLAGPAWAGVVRTAPPPGLARATAPRRVALLIGVDTYEDPKLNSLQFAAQDAEDLAEVLRAREGGSFDEVVVLSGRVSLDELRGAFMNLTARITDEDTFVLYFAGHGTLSLTPGGSEQYLLTSGSQLDAPLATGLSVRLLQDAIETLPARQRVLILDACYNGVGRSALPDETVARLRSLRGDPPPPPAREISRFDAYLYAAHLNQAAMEDDRLGNGVYTHYLIEGLRGGADIDGDHLIDVVEAHQYARDRTMSFTGGMQVPWLQTTMVGRASIFLAGIPEERQAAEQAILVGLAELPAGTELRVDGRPRGEGALEPGAHRVEISLAGQPAVARTVRVQAGERVQVADWLSGQEQRLDLGVTAGWMQTGQTAEHPGIAPPGNMGLAIWWWPADPGGFRPGFGARADLGVGAVPGVRYYPTLGAQAELAWVYGDRLAAGPILVGGVLLHAREEGREWQPFVESGLRVQLSYPRWSGGIDFAAQAFPTAIEGELPVLLSVAPGFYLRL